MNHHRGAWVAQSVKRLTSAQVMISWFRELSPTLVSALTVWSLLGILSLYPFATHAVSVSLKIHLKKIIRWGAWVAQSVKRPTLAQVMILQFMGLRPASGSVLTAWSLLWTLCFPRSLFLTLPHSCPLSSISLSKVNVKKNKNKKIAILGHLGGSVG